MRVRTYNQLFASHERHEYISSELGPWGVVFVSGTCQVAHSDHGTQQHAHARHWGVHFGKRKGKLVSDACGVTILVHSRIPSRALHTLFVPPVQIRGRAGGIRIRTNEADFVAFCIYLAPVRDAKHTLIAERFFKWIDHQLDALG
eukprot:9326878-Pyramimonas_sp.AAC.1